jgi:putative adenylate-forming enzyme
MSAYDLETRNALLFFLLAKYRFRYWDRDRINNYQRRKSKRIVEYAKDHAEFFRELYGNLEQFHQLPTIDKKVMMENFSSYNTLNLKKDEVLDFALQVEKSRDFSRKYKGLAVGMSSGTSGNKGLVITTSHEENYLKAIYTARLNIPRKLPIRAAFILRVSSPAFSYQRPWFSLTYINQLQVMERITDELNALKPDMLAASPSMLELLGKQMDLGILKIDPLIVYSYAEVLEDHVKDKLSNQFTTKIHQIYQGSEGTYAMTCPSGRLHINEDLMIFELFDKDRNPVPDGEPSYRTVVTDLHKRSQPIIRYELNDIITIDPQPCPCGSTFKVIKSIQGRANDLIWGLRKQTNNPHFIYQDYISRGIISVSEQIEDFQVLQHDYLNMDIRLKIPSSPDVNRIKDEINKNIISIFNQYDCKIPNIRFLDLEPEVNPYSGKLIRIQSKVEIT